MFCYSRAWASPWTGTADSSTISDQQFSSLTARTYDGLSVELELSYQYRLEAAAESLASLYRDFGLDYEVAYIRESRDVLRTSASRFSAFEYFYNRSSVAAAMQQELTEALSRWHANVEAFQLLEYQLPSSFAIAIENTEVARQEVEQMELQLSVAGIDAATRLLSSQYQVLQVVSSSELQVVVSKPALLGSQYQMSSK